MPIYNEIEKYTVVNGGGTVNLDVTRATTTRYVFSGTATLAAGYVIQSTGTPLEGMEFDIRWQAVVTTAGSNVVTIFGTALTTVEALKELIVNCYYNGSGWKVTITEDGGNSVTNGLSLISGSIGLGGTLTQDTTIAQSTFSTTLTGTAVDVVFNDSLSGTVPFTGFTSDEGSGLHGYFGRLDATGTGGSDDWTVSFADDSPAISNGLNVRPTQATLSIYSPTGDSQVGYSAYDGTGGFTHSADMFWYDVALDLDVTLIQAKETEGMIRFAYDQSPGTEEYNSVKVNSAGITLDASGGISDDRFISITGLLQNFANDAAAAVGGVPVGALYRNGSIVMIRVA